METTNNVEYKAYPQRYGLLTIFSLTFMIVFFQLQSYPSIGDLLIEFYGISYQTANLLGIILNIGNIIFFYPVGKYVEKFGLRVSMFTVGLINSIGAVLKCFTNKTNMFPLLAFGQSLVSLLPLMLQSSLPVMASAWFKTSEASFVFGTGVSAFTLGFTLAFFLPMIVAKTATNFTATQGTLLWIAIVPAVINITLFLFSIWVFKEKPETPPSLAEHKRNVSEEEHKLMTLLKNKNGILICVCCAFACGFQQTIAVTLNQSVLSSINNANVLTISGILLSIAGIPGSFITGFTLQKYPKYKTHQMILSALLAISCILYVQSLWLKSVALLHVSTFLIGYLSMGLTVVLMDYLVEVTYPFPESISFVFLHTIALFPGIAFIPIITSLASNYDAAKANILLIPFALLNLILVFFIKEDLRRRDANDETRPILRSSNQSATTTFN